MNWAIYVDVAVIGAVLIAATVPWGRSQPVEAAGAPIEESARQR